MYSYTLGYLKSLNNKCYKIFSCRQKYDDVSNFGTILFEVLHYKQQNMNNSFIKKKYFLTYNKMEFSFIDCETNEVVNSYCFINVSNNYINVYFYPEHNLSNTIINILYANNLSLFDFNILGKCDIVKNSLSNVYESSSNNKIEEIYLDFQNNWVNYNSALTNLKSKVNYKNNMVNINIKIKDGIMTNNTIITNIPSKYRPTREIYQPCFVWDGNVVMQIGFAVLSSDGSIKINGITTNELLYVEFSYLL